MNEMDTAIAGILRRPSGQAAYEKRTSIVQVAHMVQKLRADAKLTQKQLADAINTQQSAISKLESYDNDHMPNVSTLIDIAHACGHKLVVGSAPIATESTVEVEVEPELLTM